MFARNTGRACAVATLALAVLSQRAPAQTPPFILDSLRVTVGSRVSAGLPLATRAVEVLTAEAIAGMPVRTVQEAIAAVFGTDLLARSPAQADLAIRGGSVEQVLVLVNGIRASNAQTGHLDLDLAVPLDDVDRIEILRGPGSALFGADAFGGVVNIVTRRMAHSRIGGRVEGGSFGSIGIAGSATLASQTAGASLTAEHRRADGHRPGTDYEITAIHASAAAPLAGRRLHARLGLSRRDFGAAKFYTSPEADFDEFEKTRVLSLALAWEDPSARSFAIEPRLAIRRHDDDFVLRRDDPDFYHNIHRTWLLGGEVTARYAGAHLRAALGFEAWRDRIESASLGDRDEDRAALFTEAALGRLGSSTLSAGLRADHHSTFGTFIAPTLAGAWWIAPDLHLRGSAGRAWRAPTWTDRFYTDPANLGDPDLQPERGWEGELGIEWSANTATLSATAFLRSTDNLIDWVRPATAEPTTPWQITNIGTARFRGLELALSDLRLRSAHIAAFASFIGFDASSPDGLESKYALRPVTRHFGLRLSTPLLAELDLFLQTTWLRRPGEDGHVSVDARLLRHFGSARLFLDATNLTGSDYLDVSRMPAPGTALRFGLEIAASTPRR